MKSPFKAMFTIFSFGIIVFLTLSFIPAKYSIDFKTDKKEIDTLTVLSSVVQIVAQSETVAYNDSSITVHTQEMLDSLIHKMLGKKYSLEILDSKNSEIDALSELCEQLDRSPDLLNKISAKQLLSELNVAFTSKYALMLIYYGQFNPEFRPDHNVRQGLATSSIIINPDTKPDSDMRLMVIDTDEEMVVFYDRVHSSNFDPRVSSEVEQLARKVMKKMYYK